MPSVPPPPGKASDPPPDPLADDSQPPPAPSSPPGPTGSSNARPKRPRYLVVALIGAMLFGAGCWTEGCSTLTFYRGERDQSQALHAQIKSDVDRARAEALYRHFTDVADDSKSRSFPLAAATFVLGAALLAFAARGLAGKTNSRNALLQVVTAQAAVVALTYFLAKDVRNAELDWQFETQLIHQHERLPPDQYEQIVPMMQRMRHVVAPSWLVLRTLASALIVFALTRPRSREFFEAAGNAVSER